MMIVSFASIALEPRIAPSVLPAPVPPTPLPTDGTSYFALAYGSTSNDRTLLSNRIAGYQAPALDEVFNAWRRVAANIIYNSESEAPNTPAYCSSNGMNASRNWNPAVNPSNGATIDPGTHSECVNSNSFVSS